MKKAFLKGKFILCALQVFLCALISRPLCEGTLVGEAADGFIDESVINQR